MGRAWTRFLPAPVRAAARSARSTIRATRELEQRTAEVQRLRRKLNARVEKSSATTDESTLLLDWPGGEIRLAPSSGKRTKAWQKEPFTVEWIEENLAAGEVLYDVGANAGAYSLIAATAQPDAHVVAFEPSYATFALLCENIRLNELGERITPIPVPLAATTGLTWFRYSSVEPGAASHNDLAGGLFSQQMLTLRLDDVIERFGLPRPNHVKLDVDGSEVDVLSGAVRTLSAPDLRTLMIELPPGDTSIERFLAGRGFALVVRHEKPVEDAVAYGLFTRAS